MRYANSEYITFVDSDDWISDDCLEKLYEASSEKSDIVRASYKFYYNKANTYESARIRKIHIINENSDMERLSKGYAGAFVWAKLYKASLLKDNDIYFYESRISEDCPFSAMAYLYSKNITFIKDEVYFYRKQVQSLTSNSEKINIDAFYNVIMLTNDLIKRNFCKEEIHNFYIHLFLYKIGKLSKNISIEKQKELVQTIINHLNYLKIELKNVDIININ